MTDYYYHSHQSPRAAEPLDLEADLGRARMLAHWWDSQFNIAGIQFGMDALIGLIPGIGDTISAVASLYPVYVAQRHGLPRHVQARMLANVGIDFAVGSIPLLGDIFDVAFKANKKNLEILEKAIEAERRKKS